MFSIRILVVVNMLSLIIVRSEYHEQQSAHSMYNNDLIIDPLQLVLYSTDTRGVIYCNSRRRIDDRWHELTASIDEPIHTAPRFQFRTELHNSTTIRIVISPNQFIGMSRVYCHWDHNQTYGRSTDLIIGEKPGPIQLKEPCRAYDRRYVQCIFHAPVIARAFRNRFPQLFKFSVLNHKEHSYRAQPKLVNITDNDELVFHFDPLDRSSIPAKTDMTVNITLPRFGSTDYQFAIEPLHTTDVNFSLETISSKKLTIRINHNRTGTITDRLCAGNIRRVDDQERPRASSDIAETADQIIDIDHLRASTKYEVCLRCYYERTDHSFKDKKCAMVTTKFGPTMVWILAGSAVVLVILIMIFAKGCSVRAKRRPTQAPSNHSGTKTQISSRTSYSSINIDRERLRSEHDLPPEHDRYILITSDKYQLIGDEFGKQMTDGCSLSPDTKDLTRRTTDGSTL